MKPLGSRNEPASRSTAPAAGAGAGCGIAGSATPGAVIHGHGRLLRLTPSAHDAQEPANLVPEEERHGDGGRDGGLDDEAAGTRIDVREFKHVRWLLPSLVNGPIIL